MKKIFPRSHMRVSISNVSMSMEYRIDIELNFRPKKTEIYSSLVDRWHSTCHTRMHLYVLRVVRLSPSLCLSLRPSVCLSVSFRVCILLSGDGSSSSSSCTCNSLHQQLTQKSHYVSSMQMLQRQSRHGHQSFLFVPDTIR